MIRRPPRSTRLPYTTLCRSRRLVDPAGDRLEVGDVEGPRVEVAVPADDVERVVRVDVPGPAAPVLHVDLDLGAVDEQRLDRKSTRLNSSPPNISSAVFCLKK